ILDDKWSFAKTYACGELMRLGSLARPAVPALIRALDSGDNTVEREVARALGEIAVDMAEPVEPLRKRVREFKNDAAWFACEALGKIGRPALVAIPDLEEAAKSPVDSMSRKARHALLLLRATGQN